MNKHTIKVIYEDMDSEAHSICTPDNVTFDYVMKEIKRWNCLLYSLVDIDYMEGSNEEKLRQCFEQYCDEKDIELNMQSAKKIGLCDGTFEPTNIYGDEGRHMGTLLNYMLEEHNDWSIDTSSYYYVFDFDNNEFN